MPRCKHRGYLSRWGTRERLCGSSGGLIADSDDQVTCRRCLVSMGPPPKPRKWSNEREIKDD